MMSNRLKINSAAILCMAVLFYFFFMYAKHNAALSAVNPFAEDPYDAIGSFGIQASIFLSVLSLIRVFRRAPSDEQKIFAIRTQLASVLAVAVTLAGDLVAMLCWPSMWMGTAAGYRLAVFLGGMTVSAILLGWLVLRSANGIALPATPSLRNRAMIVSLIAVAIAGFYPKSWSQGTLGGLWTVIVGIVLLFAPIWALGTALIPYDLDPRAGSNASIQHKNYWGFIALLGLLMGIFFVIGESTEGGGGRPPAMVALVFASVYVGLETAGLLVGYGFLRKYLGLFRRYPKPG